MDSICKEILFKKENVTFVIVNTIKPFYQNISIDDLTNKITIRNRQFDTQFENDLIDNKQIDTQFDDQIGNMRSHFSNQNEIIFNTPKELR